MRAWQAFTTDGARQWQPAPSPFAHSEPEVEVRRFEPTNATLTAAACRRRRRLPPLLQAMVSFEANEPTERPDPTHYLRKREGSPGGLKQAQRPAASKTGSPGRHGSPGGSGGLIPAARGASPGSPGSPGAAVQRSTTFWKMYQRGALPIRVDQDRPGEWH